MIPRCFSEFVPSAIAEWLDGFPPAADAALLLAFVPEAEKGRLGELQLLCRQRGLRLLGAIFPALLTQDGFASKGLILVRHSPAPPAFLLTGLLGDSRESAAQLAARVEDCLGDTAEAATLFMIFDAQQPDVASVLVNLHEHLQGRVAYAGVNAGSESFQPMPCLFDERQVVERGVIALLLDAGCQVAVHHGYPVSAPLMRASSSEGNRIDRIDGEPAMQAYQRVIAAEFGIALTPENFYDYAVHYPFGLIAAVDVLVRIPVACTEDGSIFCVGEIPPNSMLRLLRAPPLAESSNADRLAAMLDRRPGQPLLVFYCAGRRMHFQGEASSELHRLAEQAGNCPLFGALSLGEISTDRQFGIPWFHNAAIVGIR